MQYQYLQTGASSQSKPLSLKQLLRIVASKLPLDFYRIVGPIEPITRIIKRLVWIIDREHDPVRPTHINYKVQQRRRMLTSSRDPDVLIEVLEYGLLERLVRTVFAPMVDAVKSQKAVSRPNDL